MLPNPLLTTMLVLSIKSTGHNYVNSSEVPRTPSSLPIQTKRQVRLPKQSTNTGVPDSKSPAYPTHQLPKFNVKL